MTNQSVSASAPGRGMWGDDTPAEPEVQEGIPDHLDVPIGVPEADALDQEREVVVDVEAR